MPSALRGGGRMSSSPPRPVGDCSCRRQIRQSVEDGVDKGRDGRRTHTSLGRARIGHISRLADRAKFKTLSHIIVTHVPVRRTKPPVLPWTLSLPPGCPPPDSTRNPSANRSHPFLTPSRRSRPPHYEDGSAERKETYGHRAPYSLVSRRRWWRHGAVEVGMRSHVIYFRPSPVLSVEDKRVCGVV